MTNAVDGIITQVRKEDIDKNGDYIGPMSIKEANEYVKKEERSRDDEGLRNLKRFEKRTKHEDPELNLPSRSIPEMITVRTETTLLCAVSVFGFGLILEWRQSWLMSAKVIHYANALHCNRSQQRPTKLRSAGLAPLVRSRRRFLSKNLFSEPHNSHVRILAGYGAAIGARFT
ncbi:hypothetical protein NECAME_07816 [Necator americanus]|uniref:Uncharacterized protein n=1 Tax=Necator americanus TaxID=51031 RepID=W2TM01_NECAM|nr:hypothetical protein NECAME_07816 [Necator americanus]ETN82758.1 hypothetical protein NECAME_07816 [Necator americanus]